MFIELNHVLTNIHKLSGSGKITLVKEVCVSRLFLWKLHLYWGKWVCSKFQLLTDRGGHCLLIELE